MRRDDKKPKSAVDADGNLVHPVKMTLYKNGHPFEERVAENADDLYCTVEMLTGYGRLDAAGLYQELLDSGRGEASDTFRVCNSFVKWGAMQQEVLDITVRLQRMDVSGNTGGSALRSVLGFIVGVGSGSAAALTALAAGIGMVWLLLFFMALLSTLPALFYILFILDGLAALALAILTYVIMYALAGATAVAVLAFVARIRNRPAVPVGARIAGALAALWSVLLFFLAVQAVLARWRVGDFNERLVGIFGSGCSVAELSTWGWLVWLNLGAGLAIAVATAWKHTAAAVEGAGTEV